MNLSIQNRNPFKNSGTVAGIRKIKRGSITRTLLILTLGLAAICCSKEGNFTEPDLIGPLLPPGMTDPLGQPESNLQGSLDELENYYTVEFVDAMIEIGFNLNLGNSPPNLEASYLLSPFIMENSNVAMDSSFIGAQFQDYLVTFSNQDNADLSIDLEGLQNTQTDSGNGSFITGDNSSFAVYSKTTSMQGSTPAETAIAISGVLSPNGILEVQFFGAMLDDNGDPEGVYIENNTGRIFVDGDDFSPKQSTSSKQNTRKTNKVPGVLSWTAGSTAGPHQPN